MLPHSHTASSSPIYGRGSTSSSFSPHSLSPSPRHLQYHRELNYYALIPDWTHPKRLNYIIQYMSAVLCLIYALILPWLSRPPSLSSSSSSSSSSSAAISAQPHTLFTDKFDDHGFGRRVLIFLFLLQFLHQWTLAHASRHSLKLQSSLIEYYEHNVWGIAAWSICFAVHVCKICLLYDVSLAHSGHELHSSTIFFFLLSFFLLLLHLFYAYTGSLNPMIVCAITIIINMFVVISLLQASGQGHLNPSSAVGMALGLSIQSLLLYPMLCMGRLQAYTYLFEGLQMLVWSWMFVCFQAYVE